MSWSRVGVQAVSHSLGAAAESSNHCPQTGSRRCTVDDGGKLLNFKPFPSDTTSPTGHSLILPKELPIGDKVFKCLSYGRQLIIIQTTIIALWRTYTMWRLREFKMLLIMHDIVFSNYFCCCRQKKSSNEKWQEIGNFKICLICKWLSYGYIVRRNTYILNNIYSRFYTYLNIIQMYVCID